jgi:DNA-binding protein WhiA
MNFAEVIKKEIINKQIKDRHCKKAFLAGLIRGSGVLYENEGELGLDFKVNSEEMTMLVSNFLHSLFNYDLREIAVTEDKLNRKDKFVLSISGKETVNILKELEILIEEDGENAVNLKFYGTITEKECCLKAFLRGLFVAVGNCTVPTANDSVNTGYHLELSFSHYTPALQTSEKLAENNVITKITRRRESYIVYIKSAEEIKDFIAFLPAPVSVLKLTDLIINREIVNDSNRRKNCDLGNVNRQIEASAKQIEAIEKIEQTIGLDGLKDDLRAVAMARRDNPDETLIELADRLSITKSCLNHRLRKLISIAKEL